MEPTDQNIDYDLLLAELKKWFSEEISSGLQEEILPYTNFSIGFVERSKECEKNCLSNIKNNSLQGYLFENANYADSIYKLLEEAIPEESGDALTGPRYRIDDKAFEIFNIIPQTDALAQRIERIFSVREKKNIIISTVEDLFIKLFNKIKGSKKGDKESEPAISRFKYYPIKSFFFYFLVIENFNKLFKKYESRYENILKLLNLLWELDVNRQNVYNNLTEKNYELDTEKNYTISEEEIDRVTQLRNSIEQLNKDIVNELISNAEEFINNFKEEKNIISDSPSKVIHIEQEYSRLTSNFSNTRNNWSNASYILAEDWKLELQIHWLKFTILKNYFDFSGLVRSKFSSPVVENLQLMGDILTEIKKPLEEKGQISEAAFIKLINAAKMEVKRKILLKLIPLLKEVIIKADIPSAIDQFETRSIDDFDNISKKRYLVKNTDYNRPVLKSEFEPISPHALLAFEMLPKFKAAFPELKTGFIRHVQIFQNKVSEIFEIIDFAIESTLAFYEKEKDLKGAIKISIDGSNRAENNLNDIIKLHETFIHEEVENLKVSVEGFIKDISEITNSENAFQIKMRVAKLKAIEKSKALKEQVLLKIRNFIPVVVENVKKVFVFLRLSSERLSKQFLAEDGQQFISSDTSDYLVETEEAINKLPYVYQRLFKIEPLTSFELYIDRVKPMEQLSNAYSKWKNGKFAPVVIVGEKGSGKSTFINHFIKRNAQIEKVTVIDIHEKNETPEELYTLLLKNKIVARALDPESKDDYKSIVVLEGLERLFTAEINGFDYLLKTMQLISDTYSSIFWMVSCHIYSWYYIDKSYGVSDYFGYHIKLTEITPDKLNDIIERRHNISGFKLVFQPVKEKKAIVSFKKVKKEDEQSEIRKSYFNNLNAYNNGNIAQAFLYWLRSTTKVKDDVIYIRHMNKMDYNFVQSISRNKMLTIRSVLIHNGISIDNHARLFRNHVDLSRLHLDQLLEDGLLVKKDERYFINPLIYSQLVNEFYKLNLLH